MQKTIVLVVALTLLASTAYAADWKQWRGANHDGVSTETGLLNSWAEDGPQLSWKTDILGTGYSNLSFANDMIYSMGDREEGCCLYALDMMGKERWKLRVGKAGASPGNGFSGPRCTPATDGNLIFAFGQLGDFVCADAKTGKEYWRVNVGDEDGGFVTKAARANMHWDFSMSPIIDGDRVVLPIGGEKGTVIAFKKSKEGPTVLWRSKGITDGAAYTSVVPATIGGKAQYILLTMEKLVGIDSETGAVLWQVAFPGNVAVCSDPVYTMEGKNSCYIMASCGYGVGARCYKVTFNAGKFQAEEIWAESRLESHHGGIVSVNGHFYLLTQRELTCVDPKTGEIVWRNRSVGKGSIMAVDGKLLVRSEAGEGTVALVDISNGYKELSKFDQPDRSDKNSWTYPTVYEGKLYLRDQNVLLCYLVK